MSSRIFKYALTGRSRYASAPNPPPCSAQFTTRKSPFGYRFVLYWVKRPPKRGCLVTQNTTRNNAGALVPLRTAGADGLAWWVEQYFQHAVTTSPASQQVQRRDLGLLLRYLYAEEGTDQCMAWTPRLARAFQEHLQQTLTPA